MQSKFTLESFKESFVWKGKDSGTRQIKEPVPTPKNGCWFCPKHNNKILINKTGLFPFYLYCVWHKSEYASGYLVY